MILSQSTEYALRIMAFLAINIDQGPHRSKDIANAANVPPFYCSKILRSMVNAKLLKAEKGHGGGFVLAKAPKRIKFIEIFEAIEREIEPRRCVFGLTKCSSTNPCPLHFRWTHINEAVQKWARNTTLAEVQGDAIAKVKSIS